MIWLSFVIPKGHYSEYIIETVILKGCYSEGSLFRRVVNENKGPYSKSEEPLFQTEDKAHYSKMKKRVVISKGHYSELNIIVTEFQSIIFPKQEYRQARSRRGLSSRLSSEMALKLLQYECLFWMQNARKYHLSVLYSSFSLDPLPYRGLVPLMVVGAKSAVGITTLVLILK